MKNNISPKPAYILIYTLLMIGLFSALVAYLFNRTQLFTPFSYAMAAREKARLLALGGVQIAIAQLSFVQKKPKEEPPVPGKPPVRVDLPQEAARTLLSRLLPRLNQWQRFALTEAKDGIDGMVELCIVSEDGKVNINKVFDFKQNKFVNEGKTVGNWKTILQEFFKKIEQAVGVQNMFAAFERFLKKQEGKPLDDITQLLTIKEFEVFKNQLYYEPGSLNKEGKQTFYLTDIFTLQSNNTAIEPWLLSAGLARLLDISPTSGYSKELLNNIKFKLTNNWKNEWNTVLKPLYQKDFASLPKGIDAVLATYFNPGVVSVRVNALWGGVVQSLLAIVQLNSRSQNGEIVYASKIKKLYWL